MFIAVALLNIKVIAELIFTYALNYRRNNDNYDELLMVTASHEIVFFASNRDIHLLRRASQNEYCFLSCFKNFVIPLNEDYHPKEVVLYFVSLAATKYRLVRQGAL